jgi:hypothetical protein
MRDWVSGWLAALAASLLSLVGSSRVTGGSTKRVTFPHLPEMPSSPVLGSGAEAGRGGRTGHRKGAAGQRRSLRLRGLGPGPGPASQE